MKITSQVVRALLLLSTFGLCSISVAETDVWHELFHAMRFADINRAQLESDCREDSRFTSIAHLKKLCEKRKVIPDTVMEEAALPYLKRHVSERVAKEAIAQLTEDSARTISNKLIVEISSGRKNQLTQSDMVQLKLRNESEYGRALSAFASDKEQGLALARALIAYEP